MSALLACAEVLGINIIKLEALGSTRELATRTVDDAFYHAILLLDNRFRRRGNRCGRTILGNGIDARRDSLLINKWPNAVVNQNNRIFIRYAKPFKLRKTIKDGILTRLATWNNRQDLGVMSVLDNFAHMVYTRGNTNDYDTCNHRMLFKMVDGMSDNRLSAQLQKLLGNYSATHT